MMLCNRVSFAEVVTEKTMDESSDEHGHVGLEVHINAFHLSQITCQNSIVSYLLNHRRR